MRHRTITLALLALAACAPARGGVRLAPDLTSPAAIEQWELQDPASWAVEDGVLRLHTAGRPAGLIRRPSRWAVLRSESLGDVEIDAQVRADAPAERMGRDALVVLGYQSPTRFYYVHLSNETTYPHNGIFLVNDADRVRLDDGKAVPRLMDTGWHDVRVVRDVDTGEIAVYLDDMSEPLMRATDTTLAWGRVGFGSFDDPASFRAVRVRGEARRP
jgi:hypothetical protein